MKSAILFCCSIVVLILNINADIYMHCPRGSNNRLNEKSANRNNANRAFDSQNNNRGGYNVGDKKDKAATTRADQYQMKYFTSSKLHKKGSGVSNLPIEWTNQHGCGGNEDDNPNKMNCNLVFQYMCEPNTATGNEKFRMKDGIQRNTQNYQNPKSNENENEFINRKNQVDVNRVYQESFESYDKCTQRDRNNGLFTADQRLRSKGAKYTRQNPKGNRRGYECPEERDYYPYWHPSVWKDIGVLAQNDSLCDYYQKESYNVKSKFECVENWPKTTKKKHYSRYNNKIECEAKNGVWTEFHNYLEKATKFTTQQTCLAANTNAENKANKIAYKWGIAIYGTTAECLVALDAPFCRQSPFSRVNHLGNGDDLEMLNVNWEIPHFPSGVEQRCVLRIRYNISTDDYDPYNTDSSSNGAKSPVKNNPTVDVGADNVPLRLAINTAQFGRTFQDRSHLFILKARTASIGDSANLRNLNVRGKRGNIVQTYPAVEYDFYPTNLKMKADDLLHIQWTGSNTHNNGNPGGDGQTGDAGQGTGGTDRSNIIGLGDRAGNFPLPMENPQSLFNNVKSVRYNALGKAVTGTMTNKSKLDVAIQFASSGYYHCVEAATCQGDSLESKSEMNDLLNNAAASFEGMVLEFEPGTYNYTCTRNNNFSNRSQKGTLVVV
jgi:hypothetical protein